MSIAVFASRSALAALTAAQAAAYGKMGVLSEDMAEAWYWDANSVAAAADGEVIVPSDAPAQGRILACTTDQQAVIVLLNAISQAPAASITLLDGRILIGGSDGAAHAHIVSGDGTLDDAGNLLVTKTDGVAFGSFATGTDAKNLTGQVPVEILSDILDADGTLAANSDSKLATQKAVKTFVEARAAVQDMMVYKGIIDCSSDPSYPAADTGHTYRISVAGKIGGASGEDVEVGDMLICLADDTPAGDQATVGLSWNIIQVNTDGTVVGPASSTDGNLALFDGTTGKLLKDNSLSKVLDAVLGSTHGSILYRGETKWSALAPGTSGQALVSGGAGADPSWADQTGGGGRLNHYPYSLNAGVPPLSAFTQINIGGSHSVVENPGAALSVISLATGSALHLLRKVVPSIVPYRIAIHAAINSDGNQWGGCCVGWSDGTKFHVMIPQSANGQTDINIENWSNYSTRNAYVTKGYGPLGYLWYGLYFDGTTVYFQISTDGANWTTLSFYNPSISYLAGAYDYIVFGTCPFGPTASAFTVDCYDEAGLSRVAGYIG